MSRARIPYAPAELAWLFANRFMVIGDYTAAFNAKFGRDLEPSHLNQLRKRKGWKVGRAGAVAWAKRRPRAYTPAEIVWLEANCTLPIAAYTRAFNAAFGRAATAANLHNLKQRRKWKTGRTGRFEKGEAPANKGKPCPPGKGGRHPNAQRTHFKPGERRGIAVKLYKPIGHERLSKEGYLERKIHDGLPLQSRWRAVHLIRWEAINGPVPIGHCLKCLDGDIANTDPSNWKLISRGALAVLNRAHSGLHFAEIPKALKPAAITLAQVKAAKTRRARHG